MATGRLYQTGQVKLDGTGAGTAKVGPISAREVWHPDNASVSVATNTLEAQCLVYVGLSPTAPNFRDGCVDGSTGDATDRVNADTVKCGEYVWAVWTGGDANAIATLTVTGTKDI